ncbi:putative chromatin regulator PHD family [Helianthus annuus]|nr:putative chromatin regulator PHD family [Helianthus annuus]
MCSGCRLPFNFKRKRHNCYNCGLVFCHSCSSKKSTQGNLWHRIPTNRIAFVIIVSIN